MRALEYAVRVRMLLHMVEENVGLDRLTDRQRDMLCAFVGLERAGDGVVRSEDLRKHPLVAPMTHPTYHRTLRALIDMGLIRPDPRTGNGSYLLQPSGLQPIVISPQTHDAGAASHA